MTNWTLSEKLEKTLKKVCKKDKIRYLATLKKIEEIINVKDFEHYKNLRYKQKEFKRVHIDSHFVLIFRIDKEKNRILFEDLQHYDAIYG